MNDVKIIRWTGIFGLIGSILFLLEIPLWIIPKDPPLVSNAVAHAKFLADYRVIAITRVLIDIFLYMSLMVFYAGFRHLIYQTKKEYEWLATLNFGASIVWWAVTLVADGLQGGAVLDTVGGTQDPSAVRALVEGTLLIYNGSIAFAVTALFMGTAGYAILATGALPKWIGWLGWINVFTCFISIPAMYVNSVNYGFYNVSGWGPAIAANVPPLIWFFAVSIALIQKSNKNKRNTAIVQ